MRYLVYNVAHPVVPINSPQLTITHFPVITALGYNDPQL